MKGARSIIICALTLLKAVVRIVGPLKTDIRMLSQSLKDAGEKVVLIFQRSCRILSDNSL